MAKNLKLQVMLDAIDRATGPLKKIAKGSTGAGQALRETRDHLRTLENAQKDLKGFANLKRSSESTAASLDAQQRNVRDLTKQIQSAEGSTKQLTRQRSAAIRQAKKLKDQYSKERRQLQDLRGKIRSVDGVTGSLSDKQRELTRRIEKTNNRLRAQHAALDRIGKAKVSEKFNNMTGSVGRFARQTALAATIAGGSMGALGHTFASQGEDVRQWSARLGMGVEKLSSLHYVGGQFGVQADAMTDAIKELSLRTDEFAVAGSGPAAEAFERLGFTAGELHQLSGDTGALFDTVLSRVRDIENVAARQRIVDELFGGSGGEQMAELASASADEIARLTNESTALGAAFDRSDAEAAREYMQAWRRASGAVVGLRNTVGRQLAPELESLFNEFTGWVLDNREKVQEFARTLGEGLRDAVPVILSIARGLAWTASIIGGVTSALARMVGGFDNLTFVLAALWALKPVLTILAFSKAMWGLGSGVIALAKTLPSVAVGFKAVGVAIAATPIGWIIGGIAAVAAAGTLIYKNWSHIAGFFNGMWSEIKEAFSGGIAGVGKLIINWSPWGLFYRAFAGVLSWFGIDLPSKFTDFGAMLITGLKDGIMGTLKAAKDAVLGAGDAVIGWFKSKLGINSPSKVFAGFGTNTMQGYEQGIKAAEKAPVRRVGDVAKRIGRAGAGIALGGAITTGAAAGTIGIDAPNSIPLDTRGPMAAGSRSVVVQGDHITLNVYPSQGMDEQALAAYIERMLDQREQRKAARARSAFHDID